MTRGRAKPAPLVSSRPPALSGTSSHPASRLSMLDSVFRAIESFDRPQDFTVILQLRDPPDREALRAGARSARNLYPTTGCRVEGGYWIRLPESPDEVYHADLRCEPQHPGHRPLDINEHLARFLDDDLDLTRGVPVRQLLVTGAPDEGACLATRFHHAAGDYMSAMMWLRHQLQVALRLRPEADEPPGPSPIALRRHTGRGGKGGYVFSWPASRLWRRGHQPSRSRRWLTTEIDANRLRDAATNSSSGGVRFTYNDILVACTLQAFWLWNRARDHRGGRRIGVWLPMNIRQQLQVGFGNGCSRIRISREALGRASLKDLCQSVRLQVDRCKQEGQWSLPKLDPFARLPYGAAAFLLRTYLRRPWIDMATGVFSHAERWPGQGDEAFRNVERLEFVGQLHRRYPLALNATTLGHRTWLTFTYDPALLSRNELERFVSLYRQQLDTVVRRSDTPRSPTTDRPLAVR